MRILLGFMNTVIVLELMCIMFICGMIYGDSPTRVTDIPTDIEIVEQSDSLTQVHRGIAIKYHVQYLLSKSDKEKELIEEIIRLSLVDFDADSIIKDPLLLLWLKKIKGIGYE